MRAYEFINESMGGTCSGSVATMSMPIGEVVKRTTPTAPAKYANSYNPKKTKNVNRRS